MATRIPADSEVKPRPPRSPLQAPSRSRDVALEAAVAPPPAQDGPRFEYLELFLTARLPLEGQAAPWRAVVSESLPMEEGYRNEAAALNHLGALGWRVVAVDGDTDRTARVVSRHYVMERRALD